MTGSERDLDVYLYGLDLQATVTSPQGRSELIEALVQSGTVSRLVAEYLGMPQRTSDADRYDLEQTVTERAFRSLAQFQGDNPVELVAWLRRIVRNASIDRWRRSHRETTGSAIDLSRTRSEADDNVAHMLSEVVNRERIVDAFRWAHTNHDDIVVTVLAEWLRLAEESGESPSNRAVAEAAGITHPTVAAALRRVRAFFRSFQEPS